ncbi:MAG: Fur family transcriptional regulator [Candidatus Eisenbacteria bacterium]
MRVPEPELARRLERFKSASREAGIKLTHQRLEIFREVASTQEHPDAETVFQGVSRRVPTVSLDTVYRTLWLLEDLGLISTLGPRRERTRFDANLDSHHHFVCENCGLVRDFESAEFDALDAPSDVKHLGSVSRVCVEVKGLCRECSERGSHDGGGE